MRSQLEAEKRKAAEAESERDELRKMIEESRLAYQVLYQACEKVVLLGQKPDLRDEDNWFDLLCEEVSSAMADAELASPFGTEGKSDPEATYCRTCGRPITPTTESQAYCPMCSRSTKVQTEEPFIQQPSDIGL